MASCWPARRCAAVEAAGGLRRRWFRPPAARCHSAAAAPARQVKRPSFHPRRTPAGARHYRCGDRFRFSPEVADAFENRRAASVVALESTIISHGMPFPENVETAVKVEQIIREGGGVPATVAILDGEIHVGLTSDLLEKLGKLGKSARKTSRRDLAAVVSQGLTGATTVASTMLIAHRAGIKLFVTGGIGGVHRGGENSMDISADLNELGRTPVAVVCAGVKSILDISKTLEYLETQGVTVATVSEEHAEFPAFFARSSGERSPLTLRDAKECAALIAANHRLELNSGMVFAVPIPQEQSFEGNEVERAIKNAVEEAEHRSITGRDVTPFILKRVNELSCGRSLSANVALVLNNAKVGAAIAHQLQILEDAAQDNAFAGTAT